MLWQCSACSCQVNCSMSASVNPSPAGATTEEEGAALPGSVLGDGAVAAAAGVSVLQCMCALAAVVYSVRSEEALGGACTLDGGLRPASDGVGAPPPEGAGCSSCRGTPLTRVDGSGSTRVVDGGGGRRDAVGCLGEGLVGPSLRLSWRLGALACSLCRRLRTNAPRRASRSRRVASGGGTFKARAARRAERLGLGFGAAPTCVG